jgi:hypothetical protein
MPSARPNFVQMVKSLIRRLRRNPQPPGDPYADKLVPVPHGPKSRSGAAVAEPEEESFGCFPPRKS